MFGFSSQCGTSAVLQASAAVILLLSLYEPNVYVYVDVYVAECSVFALVAVVVQ